MSEQHQAPLGISQACLRPTVRERWREEEGALDELSGICPRMFMLIQSSPEVEGCC